MHNMNDYLATAPFDLYELSLFHLVVKHRSFTKAAEAAGVTQSAITRQMQGMVTASALICWSERPVACVLPRLASFYFKNPSNCWVTWINRCGG